MLLWHQPLHFNWAILNCELIRIYNIGVKGKGRVSSYSTRIYWIHAPETNSWNCRFCQLSCGFWFSFFEATIIEQVLARQPWHYLEFLEFFYPWQHGSLWLNSWWWTKLKCSHWISYIHQLPSIPLTMRRGCRALTRAALECIHECIGSPIWWNWAIAFLPWGLSHEEVS